MAKSYLLFVVLIVQCSNSFEIDNQQLSDEAQSFRLPSNVIPRHYDLYIRTDNEIANYNGIVAVAVEIREVTDTFVLNSLDVKIGRARFRTFAGRTLEATSIKSDVKTEMISIEFDKKLSKGNGTLTIEFSRDIRKELDGFYRSEYVNRKNETKLSALTMLEPVHARLVFPCWDEPALKATFNVTLEVPKELLALSNMDVATEYESKRDENFKIVRFARTPPMTTYILVIVIGEFDNVAKDSSDGLPLRVFTPIGKSNQGQKALDVTEQSLHFFESYFKVPYPLPKLDLIAVKDFSASAEENWGLILFRETALLVDDNSTALETKFNIYYVICHEMAHQWFGNLVTMAWWDDLWLNEGFASFMGKTCAAFINPEFDVWGDNLKGLEKALQSDAYLNSHPIAIPIVNPRNSVEAFDDISYEKGSAIIRMLHQYIGDKHFRTGLKAYFEQFKYGNAITSDLWAAFSKSSSQPIDKIMNNWVSVKGYPVLIVKQEEEDGKQFLTISQQLFSVTPSKSNPEWLIPITISTELNPTKIAVKLVLNKKSTRIEIPGVSADNWIKVNHNSTGFYRVQYSKDMISKLRHGVISKSLPSMDRYGLLSEITALFMSGRTRTVDFLEFLEAYSQEDDNSVWRAFDITFRNLEMIAHRGKFLEAYYQWVRRLHRNVHLKLGFEEVEGDTINDKLLRSNVIFTLARYKDPRVLFEARKVFNDEVTGQLAMDANLRRSIYVAVGINASDATLNRFFEMFKTTNDLALKDTIAFGLTASTNPEHIRKVLEFAISKQVGVQEMALMISRFSFNVEARELVWQFFKENVEFFRTNLAETMLFPRFLRSTLDFFTTEDRAVEIEQFFAENNFERVTKTLKVAAEAIRVNANWIKRDGRAVKEWFLNKSKRTEPK